jgi:hypothetical protein
VSGERRGFAFFDVIPDSIRDPGSGDVVPAAIRGGVSSVPPIVGCERAVRQETSLTPLRFITPPITHRVPRAMSPERGWLPARIVSGGQSGVDRAALDVAMEVGIEAGGWCPAGRAAEDGRIDDRYPLRETPESRPGQRTEWNVRDSDATLVICHGEPAPESGTAYTVEMAERHGRPWLLVDPGDADAVARVRRWLDAAMPRTLNVAGPRESQQPGIYPETRRFLTAILTGRPAAG